MNYKLCGKEIYRKDFCEIFGKNVPMPIDNIYRKMDNFYKKVVLKTHISQQVFLDKFFVVN